MSHPVDQHVANDGITHAVLLAPVVCVDCQQTVPFGWVEYGTVVCPKSTEEGGSPWGHRVSREVFDSVKDAAFNKIEATA